jgi:hypothetical protein
MSRQSSGGGWFTILIAIGGIVWLVNHLMSEAPPPAPVVSKQAPVESALSLAVSGNPQGITSTAAQELNSQSTGQLQSVQQMIGGEFDGKTFVLPGSK